MVQNPVDQRILKRVESLIQKADQVLATDTPNPPGVFGFPTLDPGAYYEWRGQSLSFLTDLLGPQHVYVKDFETEVGRGYTSEAKAGQGILRAVREDVVNGYLTTIRELIHADVFSDFLDMANYLLAEGYKDPAAVLAGGVLEEHLRQLCKKHSVDVEIHTGSGPRPKNADTMNAHLAKAGVYSVLEQKSVTAWLDLRNKAAHSKYSEYDRNQVESFIGALPDFMARNPA